MTFIKYILFLFSLTVFSQNTITTTLLNQTTLDVDILVHIDNFKTSFTVNKNVLSKTNDNNKYSYSNIQLNQITSANAFNPLKINVFYKDFNSAIILDNRLAEITKIDFNTLNPFRVVTHISTGNDTTIWLFNQNTLQIELFDYKTNKSRITSLPIDSDIIDLKSNFNFCWALTKQYIYRFNYVGSMIEKIVNDGYTKMEEDNGNIYLLKENTLYFKSKNNSNIEEIKLPKLLINQFFVTNETLYIYTDGILQQFQLKTN